MQATTSVTVAAEAGSIHISSASEPRRRPATYDPFWATETGATRLFRQQKPAALPITAGLAAASSRWRDRRLAVARLRRRGVERGALRRRNTTDTHSRLKPLLYVLLTLSYKLALIAMRSALCTLHKPRLSLHTSHRQRRPAERKFGTAAIEVATRPAATGLPAQRQPTTSP